MDQLQITLKLVDAWLRLRRRRHKGGYFVISSEWQGLAGREAFIRWALANGYKPGLELDRIDNSGGYSPDNCQWITGLENKRKERRNYEYNGVKMTLKEIYETLGCELRYSTFHARVTRYGWDFNQAATRDLWR